MTADPTRTPPPEVVLHQQRLVAGTRRVPTERVVVRRRVVTETRQFQVTVRREELEIDRIPLPDADTAATDPPNAGLSPTGSPADDRPGTRSGLGDDRRPAPPLVVVLREEVPVVQLLTQPYEKVTVRVLTIDGEQELTAVVSSERAEINELPGQPPQS